VARNCRRDRALARAHRLAHAPVSAPEIPVAQRLLGSGAEHRKLGPQGVDGRPQLVGYARHSKNLVEQLVEGGIIGPANATSSTFSLRVNSSRRMLHSRHHD
jgi:hypothetical protein